MAFDLPDLPYGRGDLAPHISEETINFHYGKHHQAYVNNLKKMTEGTDLESASLEDVIRQAAAEPLTAQLLTKSRQILVHMMSSQCSSKPLAAVSSGLAGHGLC